jgi:hypothetical protein
MDIDENDLLFSNQYIPYPELEKEVSSQSNEEFKKFYEKEQSLEEEKNIRENLEKISIKNFSLDDQTDDQNLLNTNKFKIQDSIVNTNQSLIRKTKEVITYVSVDSRDRKKTLYPKASHFKIFLGKTFYNVKSIKLASMEFPNTNAVINSNNYKIYWRNKEDIDNDKINDITKQYPIYDTTLRIGSYVATSLETEIFNKLSLVKRKDEDFPIDYHYFIVDLDLDTDIVTFTSLILSQLPVNPISTLSGSSLITVHHPNHGLKTGDQIYLVGAQTLAGINSQYLNTIHTITVIPGSLGGPSDYYSFEVNIKAALAVQLGGGNTVKSGKIAPFQFLFGDYSNTVAQNIGFPLENSSALIKTYIKSIETIYQVLITTTEPHNLINNFIYLGQNCIINGSGTPPNGVDGSRIITKIINPYSFLILVNSPLSIITLVNPTVQFNFLSNSSTLNIDSISNYNFNTVLITSFTNHNYDTSHIGSNVTLYETKTVPVLDDTHQIDGIFTPSSFTIIDSILAESNTGIVGNGGYITRNHPITTHTVNITTATSGSLTILECPNHNLRPNDKIQIHNVISTPNINGSHTIYATPNSNTITINYPTNNISISLQNENKSYIGTGLYTVSFPNHGFNNIISIQNTSGYPTGFTYGNLFVVQTQLPIITSITNGSIIRFSQTQTSANVNLNTGHKIVSIIDPDEFIIGTTSGSGLLSPITSGIIGFNQEFKLYNIKDIGGVEGNNFNNKNFTVRDIIDENNFKFYTNDFLASNTESGGGNSAYISSLIHGFDGIQKNTKDNLLNRSINLQGENYSFLCCPQLSTMMNTGDVRNIFARVILDQSPGGMVFSYLSNPKIFDKVPLDKLDELEFSIKNYDNTFYEFNDLDYSFTLQITENLDVTDSFNVSSKRGIVDN